MAQLIEPLKKSKKQMCKCVYIFDISNFYGSYGMISKKKEGKHLDLIYKHKLSKHMQFGAV